MAIPLEDNFQDVIAKATFGLKFTKRALSERSGVPLSRLQDVLEGLFHEQDVRALSRALNLDADNVVELGKEVRSPKTIELDGLAQLNTRYSKSMTVNSYLIWDAAMRDAALFDTGANADSALRLIEGLDLTLTNLFLTHSHPDHIADLTKIRNQHPNASVYINENEPMEHANPFPTGTRFEIGRLSVETRLTCGHSRGGTSYHISGLSQPVIIVGDALFARSMGGGRTSYLDALRTNEIELFSLSNETIVCPGHGPMTTIGEEKSSNPFYTKKK